MEERIVKIAFVGLGRIASLLEDDAKREKPASHAGAFARLSGAKLAAGCDTDPERRKAFGERWGVQALFSEAEAMLDEVLPDVLVVATHPDSHARLVELAVKRRVGVVVCEKPLTDSLRSARRLVGLVENSATRLLVNHERRYSRDYGRVRRLIAEKTYGRLRSVTAKLFMGRGRSPGEVLFWDGTHLIDILRFLTGNDVRSIWASGRPEEAGGALQAGFTLGSAEAFVEVACDRDHLVFEIDLSFERGRVRIGNGLYEEQVGGESPYYEKMRSLLPVEVPKEDLYPTFYFERMAEDALKASLDPGYTPVSQVEDGLAALAAIDAILKLSGSSLRRISGL